MSGTSAKWHDEGKKKPVVTIMIMLAVIFMAAACSGGSGEKGNDRAPAVETVLVPQADLVFGETPGRPAVSLEEILADMLARPGSAENSENAANWTIPADASAAAFYQERGYRPLWVTGEGRYTPQGALLVERLSSAWVDALDPAAYPADRIRAAMAQGDAVGLSAAELMLSDALIHYSADLRDRKDLDVSVLNRAAGAGDFGAFLDGLAPADTAYRHLRDALEKYNSMVMVGGWKEIPDGEALRPGTSDDRIPALRRRLVFSGDLPEDTDTESTYFGDELVEAVKRFQRRHGLTQDGAVGARSLAALNVPAEVRAKQLATNLRLQRKPESRFGDRAIVVNVAAFELVVFVGGEEVLRSRTIIGQPGWETPRMASELQWLEINPTWSVPRRIAAEEIMPKLRRDGTDYLNKRGFRLFDRQRRELDAESIDLASIKGNRLPFILRQDPGPRNPLGNVKFMFPNDEAIYLHDTPSRRPFKRANRALSHGCIRVEKAGKLAMLLLREEGWTQANYDRVLKAGKTYRVKLQNPMPLHIVTRTAWVDADNNVQFRNDPYVQGKNLQLASN